MTITDTLDDSYFQACADFLFNSISLDDIFFELSNWIDTVSNAVSKSEFAKIINKKPSYVTELIKYGRIVFDETGKKVLVDESLALIEESRDLSKSGVVERHENERAEKATQRESVENQSASPQNSNEIVNINGKAGSVYQHSKALREKYNALNAKLDYDKAIGKVLDADDVAKVVLNAATVVRSRLENMPDRYAPQFAAEQDPQRIKSIFIDAIENVLQEMSRQFKKLTESANEQATN